jgi:hypothetical protein
MAEWKKVLVSGSTIDVAALQVGSAAITSTPAELNLLDGVANLIKADFTKLAAVESTAAEIDVLDGVTAGTAAASKAVVLDSNKDLGTIRNISGSGALFSGTINAAEFVGGGSGITGIGADTVANALTVDNTSIALNSGTTFNGSAAVTVSVKADGITGAKIADDAVDSEHIAANSIDEEHIAAGAIDETGLNTSVSGTGLSGGGGTALSVDAAQTSITSVINASITKIGTAADQEYVDFSTANEVNTKINDTERLSVTATGVDITGAATVSTNLTVSGNLIVTGTTTEVQTANLNVEDKFILLNSGSSTATDESGIIFGGANGTAQTGAALVWNGDYNSNDGRLGVSNVLAANATTATVNYHLAGVFAGSATNAATALADHVGNIRVESSEIYIYV